MNEKPEKPSEPEPDLAAAIRQARLENAERAEAVADLREIELGRLSLLETSLKPIVGQAPPGVDLFDLAISPGDHPRLFLDMVAFVDMGHDRRTYRFYQDTRHGRVLIAESGRIETIASAVTNYVARRLVERERALASGWRDAGAQAQPADGKGPRAWPIATGPARDPSARPIGESSERKAFEPTVGRGRRFVRGLGEAFGAFLMLLGAIALALLIGVGVYLAWTLRLRGLWAHWVGGPPF